MTGPAAAASMTAVNALRESGDKSLFVEMSSVSMACPALALGDTPEQARANARLIASAPELFALAAKLAAICDGLNNGNSSAEHEACKLAEQAKALIDKALPVTTKDAA